MTDGDIVLSNIKNIECKKEIIYGYIGRDCKEIRYKR